MNKRRGRLLSRPMGQFPLRLIVNVCRIVVALTLILSGYVKAVDPIGTQYKLHDYAAALGPVAMVPDWLLTGAAVVLAALEFTLGVLLLFAINRRVVSRISLLFIVVMTAVTVWVYVAEPVSDCGCFGDAVILTNGQTLAKNIVLLVMTGVVAWRPKDMPRFVSRSNQWIVKNYTVLFVLATSVWSLYYLPLFDFRPYHVGADLRAAMEWGSDGRPPAILDFYAESLEGDDMTAELLGDSGYSFWLVSPHLETADDSNFGRLNMLCDYAAFHGYRFVGLTASAPETISRWQDMTGAEYEFLFMDETPLKTMIRSNPGVMLVHDGRVVRKWSCNALPTIGADSSRALALPLEASELGQPSRGGVGARIGLVLLLFVVPLLLLTLADRLWAWSRWVRKKQERLRNTAARLNASPLINHLINKGNMRKKVVAGNWKMNLTLQEGLALANELNDALAAEKPNCDVIICTPFIHLASVAAVIDPAVIGLGAENCADKAKGAYTGEVSAAMVKSTGAQYVILGHSERRGYYGETPEILRDKVLLALENGLKVIFCIGESLDEREAGRQNDVCRAELEGSVFNLSEADFSKIIIAYEPIWAIGTGKTATSEQAEEMHAYIRSLVAGRYGDAVAESTSILYGGSCKASNAPELFAKPDIDGGLIGGASLHLADFKGIIDAWK